MKKNEEGFLGSEGGKSDAKEDGSELTEKSSVDVRFCLGRSGEWGEVTDVGSKFRFGYRSDGDLEQFYESSSHARDKQRNAPLTHDSGTE